MDAGKRSQVKRFLLFTVVSLNLILCVSLGGLYVFCRLTASESNEAPSRATEGGKDRLHVQDTAPDSSGLQAHGPTCNPQEEEETAARPAPQAQAWLAGVPLSFEENQGQCYCGNQVRFLSRGRGYSFYLSPAEAVILLRVPEGDAHPPEAGSTETEGSNPPAVSVREPAHHQQPRAVVHMKLLGGNPGPEMAGEDKRPGVSNYFIGGDPSRWRINIPHFARVKYKQVYPGIDLVYYGHDRLLEYDFVVAPGATPQTIRISFEGVQELRTDEEGNLVLSLPGGDLVQHAPVVYQEIEGERQPVEGQYTLDSEGVVGFQIASYDRSRPLVIDPVLRYSSYLGGSDNDRGNGIDVDADGNAYVVGATLSTNFPTVTGSFDTVFGSCVLNHDVFVTKINSQGTGLIYSTFIGGSSNDEGEDIAIDPNGNVYVTGRTLSSNFPTVNPFSGGESLRGIEDGFVTKLNAAGNALVFSTFLGGTQADEGLGIAVDGAQNVYVTGQTGSSNFPTTSGAFDTTFNEASVGFDAFVTKLNMTGNSLLYSTFLGGAGTEFGAAIDVDKSGNAFVTGETGSTNFPTVAGSFDTSFNGGGTDAFVTKLNANGSALVYSTFLGGNSSESGDSIALDDEENNEIFVVGFTASSNFPMANPFDSVFQAGEGFVSQLNETGSTLFSSSFIGGNSSDHAKDVVTRSGAAFVTGLTASTDFPLRRAFDTTLGDGLDAFVLKVRFNGSLEFSSFLGGGSSDFGEGIAAEPFAGGNVYVTGQAFSSDFPTLNGFQGSLNGPSDAFVTKVSDPDILTPVPNRVVINGTRTITLIGQNFDLLSNLQVGGVTVSNLQIVSSTLATFTAPTRSAPGDVLIETVLQGDTLNLDEELTYVNSVTRSMTFPEGNIQNDFRMFALPVAGGSGASILQQLLAQADITDILDARIFRFNGVSYDEGLGIPQLANDTVTEGMGFWFISDLAITLSFTGGDTNQFEIADDGTLVPDPFITLLLHPGWNQVSPGVAQNISVNNAVVSDGKRVFRVQDPGNTLTNRSFFEFTGDVTNPYRTVTTLNGASAYWLFNFTAGTLVLAFGDANDVPPILGSPAMARFLSSDVSQTALPASLKYAMTGNIQGIRRAVSRAEADTPPMPPISMPASSSTTAGGGGGGGGGCFIATAAYGSSLDQRLNTLRSFRDAAFEPTGIGQGFTKTYYACSPAAASCLKGHDSARAVARKLLSTLVRAAEGH